MAMLAGRTRVLADWQLDRAYETDTERKLEEVFRDDDFPISSIESEFSMAKGFLGQAVRHLIRAANEAEKYGREKPIDELIQDLDDDFDFKMSQTIKRLKEGA